MSLYCSHYTRALVEVTVMYCILTIHSLDPIAIETALVFSRPSWSSSPVDSTHTNREPDLNVLLSCLKRLPSPCVRARVLVHATGQLVWVM